MQSSALLLRSLTNEDSAKKTYFLSEKYNYQTRTVSGIPPVATQWNTRDPGNQGENRIFPWNSGCFAFGTPLVRDTAKKALFFSGPALLPTFLTVH